jgi:hypothetical protein
MVLLMVLLLMLLLLLVLLLVLLLFRFVLLLGVKYRPVQQLFVHLTFLKVSKNYGSSRIVKKAVVVNLVAKYVAATTPENSNSVFIYFIFHNV